MRIYNYLKLLFTTCLLLSSVAFGQIVSNQLQYFHDRNYFVNPGAEQGLAGVSVSAGTLTRATAQVRSGSASFGWDASASSQTFSTTLAAIPAGNGACLAQFFYYGFGTADMRIYVKDNSANVIGGYTASDTSYKIATAVTAWTKFQVPFLCPVSGTTVQLVIEAQGNAAIGYIDDAYLGRDFRIGNQSTPGLVASGYFTGNTNCGGWTRTNTALGAFASDADCPGPTAEYNPGTLGTLQTTDADLPKFTINNLPAGEYEVVFIGTTNISTSVQSTNFAVNDGTTTTPGILVGFNAATGSSGFQTYGRFSYTTAANRTFELYASSAANALQLQTDTAVRSLYFYVRRWPSASETVVRGDQSDLSGNLKYAATVNCSWQTSTTIGAFSADTDCPTPTVSGNLTAPGTKIPGAVAGTLTPGRYLVIASSFFYATGSSSGSAGCSFDIYDGTSSGGLQHVDQAQTTYKANSTVITGTFNYTAKQSNITFQVRGSRDTGNGTCRVELETLNDLVITLIPLSGALPRPFIPGSVFAARSNVVKQGISNLNCDSGSAITTDSDTMVASVGNVSSGKCVVTLTTGYFSATPLCIAMDNNTASTPVDVTAACTSSTACSIDCADLAGTACSAYDATVFCVGNN